MISRAKQPAGPRQTQGGAKLSDHRILYLAQAEVASLGIEMAEIISLLETAFEKKGRGLVELPPKLGIHPGNGDNFIHAMPAWIPALNSAGIKWISTFPGNADQGLPSISGLLILNDPETGIPLAVMDCQWITARRTAAATALAAKRLARKDSARLGILGCGVQGLSNTEALAVIFPIEELFAYDPQPEAIENFRRATQDRLGLKVTTVRSPREAVSGCDLVVTAGPISKKPHGTIKPGWLDQGAFASLVDYDSYWHPAALKEADKFCTDDRQQIEHFRSLGYFQDIPPIHADLGELVAGLKPGRESPRERTMACNLGLALADMALAPTVYRRALDLGVGTRLPL